VINKDGVFYLHDHLHVLNAVMVKKAFNMKL